ncbi:MAG: Ig-like domain-containing protein [Myxococcaceae bacterium]|nr:Ig-like domain-containing protein [Myxococcaceae bacterium]
MKTTRILFCVVASLVACTPPMGRDPVPALDVLQVVPGSARVEAPGSLQFGALRLKDGSSTNVTSSATWTSSDPSILSITATGAATLEKAGVVTVTATADGQSGTSEVIVLGQVVGVEVGAGVVRVPVGVTTAIGGVLLAADDTKRPLDGSEVFGTSNAAVASVTASGDVTGASAGTASITLTRNGVTWARAVTVVDTALMTVTPDADPGTRLPSEASIDVFVTGTFANGDQADVTALFTVSAPEGSGVTVDGTTVAADALESGTKTVTLTFTGNDDTIAMGKTATLQVTVISDALSAVTLTAPATASTRGEAARLSATGTYGTLQFPVTASFSADPAELVSVARNGTVSWLKPGAVTFTAAVGDVEGTATTTISESALSGVTIGGAGPVMVGGTLDLTATAAFGASMQAVTSQVVWKSSAPDVVEVSNVSPGLVTAKASGMATVEAYYRGARAATVTLTVTP